MIGCIAFSYRGSDSRCWLKEHIGRMVEAEHYAFYILDCARSPGERRGQNIVKEGLDYTTTINTTAVLQYVSR